MSITNNTYQTKYFCLHNKIFVDLIDIPVKRSNFNKASLQAHIDNCKYLSLNPYHYKPVIDGIYPIPPKTSWRCNGNVFTQCDGQYIDTTIEYDLEDLKKAAHRILKIWNKPVSVELSGGLDTSIIIGLLRDVGIDPYLIGAESSRFEFRTERHIQHKLSIDQSKTCLFKDTTGLPFGNLKETPVHFLPNKSSLFYHSNMPTLKAAKEFGINVVLNGIGLDSLLIDHVGPASKRYWFDISNIDDGWANDYVFSPHGVSYINVATLLRVRKIIISMRKNQKEDLQKLWARQYFKKIIPAELSNYSYKASFGGVYFEGLQSARDEILAITNLIHSETKLDQYDVSYMNNLIDSVLSFDYKSEFLFFALLSYAVWIYKLLENQLIKD